MSRLWDRRATSYRNTRAVLAVVFLSPILMWVLATDQQLSTNKLLAVERETAIVTKITRVDASELLTKLGAGINVYQGYVELADGTEIELALVPPTPKVGDRIPILVERYENGNTTARTARVVHYQDMGFPVSYCCFRGFFG